MTTEKLPLVTIGIPTYNRAKMLKRAIDGVLKQSYSRIEIIVSDNASSDETESMMLQWCTEDSRIRYFRQKENIGAGNNFRFVRSLASGEYFLWHGDDDYLDSDYIERCVMVLERDSTVVLASGIAAYHYAGERVISRFGNIMNPTSSSPIIRNIHYFSNVWENCIFCGVYKTKALDSCSIYDLLGGDWLWISEILVQGKAVVLPEVYVHRSYGESMSSDLTKLVNALGLPLWQARYRWIAIGMNVYCNTVSSNVFRAKMGFAKRHLTAIILALNVITRPLKDSIKEYIFIKQKQLYLKLHTIMYYKNLTHPCPNENQNYLLSASLSHFHSFIEYLLRQRKKYVIYGNGSSGKILYEMLNPLIVATVDLQSNLVSEIIESDKVYSLEALHYMNYDVIIISVLGREKEIREHLIKHFGLRDEQICEYDSRQRYKVLNEDTM